MPRKHGWNPKFKVGDIVFVPKQFRADDMTFTVTARRFDRGIRTWFYSGKGTCQYAQSCLILAAHKETAEKG